MRSYRRTLRHTLLVAGLAVCGCQPERPVVGPADRPGGKAETGAATYGARQFGIGDVETLTLFSVVMSPEMEQVSGVEGHETETLSDRLTRYDMNLRPPYPAKIMVAMELYRLEDYPEGFVAVARGRVFVGEQEVHRFARIYPSKKADEAREVAQIDVAPWIDASGANVLVRGEAELVLFQNVTDASTIDAETADNDDPIMKVKKYSNPLFIHFIGREDTPSTP